MKRVLVVATDADICTLMAIFLEHLGYRVDLAADLHAGIGAVRLSPPDVILLASHPGRLPASDLLDAYADACANGSCHQPARIAVLATDVTDDPAICPHVDGSLRMPFSLEQLESLVLSLVQTGAEVAVSDRHTNMGRLGCIE